MTLFAPSQVAIIISNQYNYLFCCRLLGSMYITQFMQTHMISSYMPSDMAITISMFDPAERKHRDPVVGAVALRAQSLASRLSRPEREAWDSLHRS
jgi:hypothetical protein